MVNLFEYQNKESIGDSLDGLEAFLDVIWKNREKYSYCENSEENSIESQQFIQFLHASNEIKSNKYVGVIHFNGKKINLLPKIFFNGNQIDTDNVNQIHSHILWWLSYCRKIRFPNYQTALSGTKNDFFEVLIYLFSKYTRNLLGGAVYQHFEDINSELSFIKGRLQVAEYLRENVSTGRWHKLNCSYDAFVIDNEFNRIIKYVSQLLFNVTNVQENKKNLREILFILDEVSDVRSTADQCKRIKFNPFHGEFEVVRDYCHLFLSNYISFDYKNELKLFAFLLPMEYVFEDFIFGFIDRELPEVQAKAQSSQKVLDVDGMYSLVPDLMLRTTGRSIIADTKYKIVHSDQRDPKKGISQADLYQMLAYAIRFEVDELILFYPETWKHDQLGFSELFIEDAFAENRKIRIRAFQLPIINRLLIESNFSPIENLRDLFQATRILLKEKLSGILGEALKE